MSKKRDIPTLTHSQNFHGSSLFADKPLLPIVKLARMGVEQPVALLSELAACCLGNTYFRRHYHLWMALLVLMGPGLTYYVSHSTVFANKRNFLYLYFLRSGWGWTCLLTENKSHTKLITCVRTLHCAARLPGAILQEFSKEHRFSISNKIMDIIEVERD
ncbi:fat storage-inducing transmembrane protein 1 [Polypterus senegalus]|uniref:fat storage-inducing transmembrane protein 1 n=1 Tax=Polypterus senegalus TaxID=55291 RepID=UPI001964F05F|nr:fat storage-inducing transmembrane protein 1 [Polypterus senegalus]